LGFGKAAKIFARRKYKPGSLLANRVYRGLELN
jgi:hypothetical protein